MEVEAKDVQARWGRSPTPHSGASRPRDPLGCHLPPESVAHSFIHLLSQEKQHRAAEKPQPFKAKPQRNQGRQGTCFVGPFPRAKANRGQEDTLGSNVRPRGFLMEGRVFLHPL